MEVEVIKLYSMIYDSKEYGNNGYGEYLGEFKLIKHLRQDFYVDDFIAINTENNERYVVLSREVTGQGGGIRYDVIPIKDIKSPILGDIYFAEWEMVLDDFDDGVGDRELPHCTNCHRGVYKHDASNWCPFCGAAMKNPMID